MKEAKAASFPSCSEQRYIAALHASSKDVKSRRRLRNSRLRSLSSQKTCAKAVNGLTSNEGAAGALAVSD